MTRWGSEHAGSVASYLFLLLTFSLPTKTMAVLVQSTPATSIESTLLGARITVCEAKRVIIVHIPRSTVFDPKVMVIACGVNTVIVFALRAAVFVSKVIVHEEADMVVRRRRTTCH